MPADPEAEELFAALWPAQRILPTRVVRCRHCGQKNRIKVPQAISVPDRVRCGNCDGHLFIGKEQSLSGLSSAAYQHGLDRRSLAALRSVPGVPQLIKWVLERVGDRGAQLMFMSDAILCNEEQFPELVALTDKARSRLDIGFRPMIFLGESPYMNAMTTGVKDPVIIVRSALLDQMNDQELLAVIGHELGHLQADHPLYYSVAHTLLRTGMSTSQAVRLLSLPIHRALLHWSRCAELTADRAALLASRDLPACIRMMLTFAGGNRPGTSKRTQMRLAPFIRQCRALAQAQLRNSVDSALGGYMAIDRTHPHTAARVIHLIEWIEHGNYLNILSGDYIRTKRSHALPRALQAAPPTVQDRTMTT